MTFGSRPDPQSLELGAEADGQVLGAGMYKVSADGKTLTVTNKGSGPKGPFEVVMVLERRPGSRRTCSIDAAEPTGAMKRRWRTTLWQDIRYGCRMLAASPGFTTVAVLSLAIGIGANCAIFSFADALLLRPLPVARPGEVLSVGSRSSLEALNASSLVSSYRDYVDIRDRNRSFDGLAAFASLTAGFAADPRRRRRSNWDADQRQSVAADGRRARHRPRVPPGRGSGAGSRCRGHPRTDDVGAGVRGRPVLGRSVRINGVPFTVIGVAPAAFPAWTDTCATIFSSR